MGPSQAAVRGRHDRLESWKEIAAYLGRDIRTVQRWERSEGLPVHRHMHAKQGSVYALRSELDAWKHSRAQAPMRPEDRTDGTPEGEPEELAYYGLCNTESARCLDPWWGPGRREIVFTSRGGGMARLWRAAVPGGRPRQ